MRTRNIVIKLSLFISNIVYMKNSKELCGLQCGFIKLLERKPICKNQLNFYLLENEILKRILQRYKNFKFLG